LDRIIWAAAVWLLRRLIIEAFRALQPFRIIHGW